MVLSEKVVAQSSPREQLLDKLSEELGSMRCDLWFGEPGRLIVDSNQVVVNCDSQFEVRRVERKIGATLRRIVSGVLGAQCPIRFELTTAASETGEALDISISDAGSCDNGGASLPFKSGQKEKSHGDRPRHMTLTSQNRRPEFALDRFWFGSENELVQAAVNQSMRQPGCFSPLLIHGPTGSGKTHLLEALSSVFRSKLKFKRCVFLTAEEFTNSFVQALRGSGLPMFRKKYRDLDLLAIDDIHFLAGKRATISEMQYTIDQLARTGKQLIVSADRPPSELNQLGPELSARLGAGLNCPLRYPDVAGRLQIMEWWCQSRGWQFAPDILRFVAEGIGRDCRRLAGALNRLRACAITNGAATTIESARRDLADLLQPAEAGTTLAKIEQAICEMCGLQAAELKSPSRAKRVSSARMLAMWLSRQHTGNALSEIGDYFGGRSHSTVVAAHRRIDSWMQSDKAIDVCGRRYSVRDAVHLARRKLQVG